MAWVAPDAGALRARLTIETPAVGVDEATAWTSVATTWGEIAPQGAGERETGGRAAGIATHRVTIRWRGDVGSADRLRLGARIFNVRGVFDPDERRRFLVLLAEEER